MQLFLTGALALASLVVSLFFLRFWRKTGDRFFMLFALAFAFETLDRLVMAFLLSNNVDGEPTVYALRLVTFGLILAAIIDKNRKSEKQ